MNFKNFSLFAIIATLTISVASTTEVKAIVGEVLSDVAHGAGHVASDVVDTAANVTEDVAYGTVDVVSPDYYEPVYYDPGYVNRRYYGPVIVD